MDEPELDEENLPDRALLASLCAGLVIIDPDSDVIRLGSTLHCTKNILRVLGPISSPTRQSRLRLRV